MAYQFHIDEIMEQCRSLYAAYPVNVSEQLSVLDRMDRDNPDADSYTRKSWIYQVAAQHCDVHIFPACPFYAEVVTGRERNSVTSGFPPNPGLASWLMNTDPSFAEEFGRWSTPYRETGVFVGEMFTDTAHHYADCETVLLHGYEGIRRMALEKKPETGREASFLKSVMTACESACRIAANFSRKAAEMLEMETRADYRENLERIRDTAVRVPKNPAQTFYEALCTVWFVRELCNALEGMGFAVLGHLDRVLYPYYQRDLEMGRISRREAKELLACFLSLTDARWDLSDIPGGTNASFMVGGCDENGHIVFNEVTRMIIEVFLEHPLANPKLQARVSLEHPPEYVELLGQLAGQGRNVLSVFNDPVVIQAHVNAGKQREDCNRYLAGGCQEIVIRGEVNCRAYVYLNLPQMLLMQLLPGKWDFIREDGIFLQQMCSAGDYETFYHRFLYNMTALFQGLVAGFNRFEGRWREYNPCPLFSAVMEGCIQRGMDITEGGAKYNSNSFGMAGFGTLVDSLYAIRECVYRRSELTLQALCKILEDDFQGHEPFRQTVLNKLPKYGQADPDIQQFARQVLKDLSGCIRRFANARGGYYEASLFSFYSYSWLQEKTGATPDGRRAGKPLSRGINPSESTGGIDAATLIYTQSRMEYTGYPGGAVLYVDLPVTKTHLQSGVYKDVILYFLKQNGCIMDFNVVNREQLLRAQSDPENNKNITVRVCGYSAPFYCLSREMQDEVIARIQR